MAKKKADKGKKKEEVQPEDIGSLLSQLAASCTDAQTANYEPFAQAVTDNVETRREFLHPKFDS